MYSTRQMKLCSQHQAKQVNYFIVQVFGLWFYADIIQALAMFQFACTFYLWKQTQRAVYRSCLIIVAQKLGILINKRMWAMTRFSRHHPVHLMLYLEIVHHGNQLLPWTHVQYAVHLCLISGRNRHKFSLSISCREKLKCITESKSTSTCIIIIINIIMLIAWKHLGASSYP